MKTHILISSLLLFVNLSFAQKMQVWIGPTYSFIPKSVTQNTLTFSFQSTEIQGKDTSYYNVKNSFDRSDTLKFTPKIGISAGIRWEKKLNSKLSLVYGIGLNNYEFNAINRTETTNFKEIERTPISKYQAVRFLENNTKFIFSTEKVKEGIDYNLTELQIPLILNWKKTDFSIGIGAQLNSPIAVNTTEERLIFEMEDANTYRQVKKVIDSKNTNRIKRSSIDLSANYTQWIDKFGLEIGVSRRMTSFWDNNSSDNVSFFSTRNEIPNHKVNPISLSLRVIYMLR